MIKIDNIEVSVYRYPLDAPVQTSFGTMHDRPMTIVKLTDNDGVIGWGEIWCNFPNVGAEHRARLIDHVFAPILMSQSFENAEAAFDHLTKQTWVLGLQTGEQGPLAQCIAGLEMAMCDIDGKKKGLPLWKLFGGVRDTVPVYASGVNPTNPEIIVGSALASGYKAFKLKIGFGDRRDTENLAKLRKLIGPEADLMADANQAWKVTEIEQKLAQLEPFDLKWLEEPIAADRPLSEWRKVKDYAGMAIAAGENIQGQHNYDIVLENDILGVVQPDLAKWGGISKTVTLARQIMASGKLYCPHYLGGGIGLVASAHALAAVGGDGMLEVDINPNPLRTVLVGDMFEKTPGIATLGSNAGLGYEPDIKAIADFKVM
ncbi:mandelate racemase/muconate lactonizing enzyme family protein [Alphaproteobacteria bacterium]|nr:mandelate racemase/muconate lactonizing enzyme family protein [Alphaproteobacteria bacterium]